MLLLKRLHWIFKFYYIANVFCYLFNILASQPLIFTSQGESLFQPYRSALLLFFSVTSPAPCARKRCMIDTVLSTLLSYDLRLCFVSSLNLSHCANHHGNEWQNTVCVIATQQRYKLWGHFIYFRYTVGKSALGGWGGEENLRDSGLKQMDRFTLTSALPDDKHMKEQERVGSIWIAIFALNSQVCIINTWWPGGKESITQMLTLVIILLLHLQVILVILYLILLSNIPCQHQVQIAVVLTGNWKIWLKKG